VLKAGNKTDNIVKRTTVLSIMLTATDQKPQNHKDQNSQKFAICAPSHKFVGLYLRNEGMYQQLEKLVKQQYLFHISSPYGELRPCTNG